MTNTKEILQKEVLVDIQNVTKTFSQYKQSGWRTRTLKFNALQNISLQIYKGETLALVGESGSGKSTLGKAILGVFKVNEGRILYEQEDISKKSKKERQKMHGQMQMIFQDPFSSLNPKMTIENIIGEALDLHHPQKKDQKKMRIQQLLSEVDLPEDSLKRYPHHFSGGQRQRIVIARALAVQPEFILCDEPTSALDVSIQAQIINLLQDIQARQKMTYLFIAHDLHLVHHIADRIAVLYFGELVEICDKKHIFEKPLHPYTKALFSSTPSMNLNRSSMPIELKGEVPNPFDPPTGCSFHPRCIEAIPLCAKEKPKLITIGSEKEKMRQVSCHLYSK